VVTGMAMAAAEDSPEWHACKFPFHFLEELWGEDKDLFYKRTDQVVRERDQSKYGRDKSTGSSCTSMKKYLMNPCQNHMTMLLRVCDSCMRW
jgi:hypothetical protein